MQYVEYHGEWSFQVRCVISKRKTQSEKYDPLSADQEGCEGHTTNKDAIRVEKKIK